ncbi:MAG: flagellar biosynthetic protein FliP [Gallionellaceae bacterium]|nr:MAG: flagellar biosynthetic protein FliP [Gallionellaceae bacterium]
MLSLSVSRGRRSTGLVYRSDLPLIATKKMQRLSTAFINLSPLLILFLLFAFATPLYAAEPGLISVTSSPTSGGGQTYTLSLQTLILISSLTFLPAILLMMTGFTRIIIVLSLLRSAIGTPSSPPNQVLIGLALFLTFFVMSPVLDKIYVDAYLPYSQNKMSLEQAYEKGSAPLKTFMLRQTREADLALFVRISNSEALQTPEDVPLRILVPAYVTSELKTAFQIGFVIFIPFLIIDMVVASVLMSMGMMMVSPSIISLPFKIMLFVLADGWNLLIGSLVQSFYT